MKALFWQLSMQMFSSEWLLVPYFFRVPSLSKRSFLCRQHIKLTNEIFTDVSISTLLSENTRFEIMYSELFWIRLSNSARLTYQYSNMSPSLLGQNCDIFKFLLSINSQKGIRYKENNTKYRSLSWKPRNHVRMLMYRTWLVACLFLHFISYTFYRHCNTLWGLLKGNITFIFWMVYSCFSQVVLYE